MSKPKRGVLKWKKNSCKAFFSRSYTDKKKEDVVNMDDFEVVIDDDVFISDDSDAIFDHDVIILDDFEIVKANVCLDDPPITSNSITGQGKNESLYCRKLNNHAGEYYRDIRIDNKQKSVIQRENEVGKVNKKMKEKRCRREEEEEDRRRREEEEEDRRRREEEEEDRRRREEEEEEQRRKEEEEIEEDRALQILAEIIERYYDYSDRHNNRSK